MVDTAGQTLLIALGDSITAGVGGKWNKGYPDHLLKRLQSSKEDVKLVNWGIPGLTIPRLTKALIKGEHLHETLAAADLVVMTIGGNDLMDAMPKKMPDDLPEDMSDETFFPKKFRERFARELDELMETASRLISCPIYLGDLYNPFPQSPLAERIIAGVNTLYMHPLPKRYPNIRIVPLSRIMRGHEAEHIQYFKTGTVKELRKFWRRPVHPNDAGHEVLAEAFHKAIRQAEPRIVPQNKSPTSSKKPASSSRKKRPPHKLSPKKSRPRRRRKKR